MSGSRRQLKELFFAALERAPQERRAFVDTLADPGLRLELDALLAAHDAAGDFLEQPPPASSPTLTKGRRLGPYEVVELIGKGGMGEVYRARDTRLDRDVAIKVLSAVTGADQSWHKRFADEARAASALNHPNVLTVYDVGTLDDDTQAPFIVMELLAGGTLRSVLQRDGSLAGEVVAKYGLQIAHGLSAAHAAGIIHRDIKPENLIVTRDGRVKILDFGIAKFGRAARHFTAATAPGAVIGTAAYMSPEQVRGTPASERSDIFSLGVVMLEMLTGRQPFARDSAIETLSAILHSDPIDPHVAATAGGPALVAIIRRCLAKAEEDRYPSAKAVALALEQPAGSATRTGSRLLLASAAALLVVGLAGIGAALWQRDSTVASAPASDEARVLAVLPFENISENQSQQYFVDGITEEITAQLTRVSAIRLMSRAAMARFRAAEDVPRRLREELSVTALVTGSVRLAGDRARISVHLVDTRTNATLWTQQYDQRVNDVLQLQSEVASQIVSALQARLSLDDQRRLIRQSTSNPAAYELYLKSTSLPPGPKRAALLKEAVALDPDFAIAHAGLSRVLGELGAFGDRQHFKEALASARRAVAADPNEARAHHALATISLRLGHLTEARAGYRRALDLAPNLAEAAWDLSLTEYAVGRYDESLTWARRGFLLAPNVSTAYYHVAVPLHALADTAAAERWLRAAAERFPRASRIQYMMADVEFFSGREQAADTRVRRALAAAPDNGELQSVVAAYAFLMNAPDAAARIDEQFKQSPTARTYSMPATFRALRGYQLIKGGDTSSGRQLMDVALAAAREAVARGIEAPEEQLEIAAILAFRGDAAGSLAALRAAYRAGDRHFREIRRDPCFESLRSHAEFVAILREMEADVAAQRKRIDLNDNPPLPPFPPGPTASPPVAAPAPPRGASPPTR